MRVLFCRAVAIALGAGVSLVPAAVAIPQNTPANASSNDHDSKLAGTWRGDSLCVEKGTACHDEVAVYSIATIPGKRGYLVVTGGKVVAGKQILIRSTERGYDRAKSTVSV